MAVFTSVSGVELSSWLRNFAVGDLTHLEPIATGIDNTNYFVDTTQARFVLTLFERLRAAELPYYVDLLAHLAAHGIPCPAPIADLTGRRFSTLNGRPAALLTRLAGTSITSPDEEACAQLGALLARIHLVGRSYAAYMEQPCGAPWRRRAAEAVEPLLDEAVRDELRREMSFQAEQRYPELPRGPVHADLFRDNVLFDEGRLSGVIDFYFGGVDCLLYDVAVCVNDWCLVDPERDPAIEPARLAAMLGAYAKLRPFTGAERDAWPAMLRTAALRFWISRLHDFHLPRPGMLVRAHDPDHFRDLLADRTRRPPAPLP